MSSYSSYDWRSRSRSSPSFWFFNNVYDRTPPSVVTEPGTQFCTQYRSLLHKFILVPNALDISGVNLQTIENGSSHKTSMYELVSTEKSLVVRRGASFQLTVTFSQRNFDPKVDHLKLVFKTGVYLYTP